MDESTGPGAPRARRRLGPGMTIFLVVDVLLVLAVAVVLAAYLSGGDAADPRADATPTTSGSPTTRPTADPTQPAPTSSATAEPAGPGTFALPSGNIACEVTADAATCTIADSTAEVVPVEGCAGSVGQVVTVTAEGASTPCLQGALPGPAAAGTPVLEYGQSTTVGDFTCTSSTSGASCTHDPSGAGFTLARAGHQLF